MNSSLPPVVTVSVPDPTTTCVAVDPASTVKFKLFTVKVVLTEYVNGAASAVLALNNETINTRAIIDLAFRKKDTCIIEKRGEENMRCYFIYTFFLKQ